MAKRVSEFGKQWDERVPRYAISWLINRVHVGVTDAEIEKSIRERIARSEDAAKFTSSLINQSVRYALECHHRNRDLYNSVNRGFLGTLMKSAPNGLKA
jgi:hypothetical protein